MSDLPNTVTPEEAKAKYDAYTASFYGGVVRAEFARRKNDPE